MRIAIVSDIHGNLTAFEAVLTDLRETSPDLILHGGDLADSGSNPVEIVDRIRALGWQRVMGNTDEMLIRPEALEEFASGSTAPPGMWQAIREIAASVRSELGEERLSWFRELPRMRTASPVTLVHATPASCWRSPGPDATAAELESVYGALGQPLAVYAHTHLPSIRSVGRQVELLINTGSVGLPYDGDSRASYLLVDGKTPTIRRVEYDVERELEMLACCGLPHAEWTAAMLRASGPLGLRRT